MQFEKINGVTLHHQLIGGPEGKPVIVFANSLGTDFRIWRDVSVRLVGEYGMVLYDKRGHGLSDIGETPYSIEDHVDDLIGLIDYLRPLRRRPHRPGGLSQAAGPGTRPRALRYRSQDRHGRDVGRTHPRRL